jgi:inosine/xanthosine triphosphate pyrophosphatase family protein/dephospho-CoA kinase
MTDITFITSNSTKLAHARHLCKGYDVNILQYKKLFYGIGYTEPRLFDREKLLEESFNDAITRWKKNVSNYGDRLFFIEDTSVRIDALSDDNNEVPGVDVKYWMQSNSFAQLDSELKKKGNNRKASVSSHIILFLTNELKKKLKTEKDHIVFKSTSFGVIVKKEQKFDTQILYPWLDNKTFNKWFVPDGFDVPISMLDISEADKGDFRKGAFEKLLNFLKEHEEIKHIQKSLPVPRLNFNPLYVVCGPTCAGKSTVGKLLLEKYDYYHIEASDFMTLRYFETHGTKFSIDKNIFAAELLKVNPFFVVESTINYIMTKRIFDNFIITGFRTPDEVENFFKMFLSQDMRRIYITADSSIRYNRWVTRQRDALDYTQNRFDQINKLQEEMGLLKINEMDNTIQYENNKEGLPAFYNDFQEKIIKTPPTSKEIDISLALSTKRIALEKAILLILAIEYRKNESLYHTTTEISHLINNTFKGLTKNKNNISRYFNQAYYPYYEIKKENGKNKFKLSPTGYSEAIFIMRNMKKF